MPRQAERQAGSDLKEILQEASRALALLDADRLEELALFCQELKRNPIRADFGEQARLAADTRRELTVLGRVLEATRANIRVLRTLRKTREDRFEYCPDESLASFRAETNSGHH